MGSVMSLALCQSPKAVRGNLQGASGLPTPTLPSEPAWALPCPGASGFGLAYPVAQTGTPAALGAVE